MSTQKNLTELQKLILVSPQADKVYFNEEGEYQLYDHPGYQHKILTRDEVLGVPEVPEVTTDENPNETATNPAPTKPSNKK